MYTSASATGSTSSVSMVPGPVLSKSVRKELLPVSTRPPPDFPVLVLGLRSEGKALVIELLGSASARFFRRRTKRKPPSSNAANAPTPIARYAGLSSSSSVKLFGAGALRGVTLGGADLAASEATGGGAVFAGSGAGSAGLGGSAGVGASTGAAVAFGGSAGAGAGAGVGTGAVAIFVSAGLVATVAAF